MPPTSLPTHPDEDDLRNFARDELGERKKERILAHCRECPECAERLIEATREHAPEAPRRPLTRWQWASIILFVLALAATVGAMIWLLRSLGQAPDVPHPAPGIQAPERPGGSPPPPGPETTPDDG